MACPICGSGAVAAMHDATERMYGMGGTFRYRECARCGSLSLVDVPDDLDAFYPGDYYSLATPDDQRVAGAARLAHRWSTRLVLDHRSVAGAVAAAAGHLGRQLPSWVTLLSGVGVTFDSAVLDVGCGDGHRLRTLHRHGFRNLTGCDPRLQESRHSDAIRLTASPVDDLVGPFDVVMFHHSLEHMATPTAVLTIVRRLLSADGAVVIRLPLAGSWAWRAYGTDWVQLDAPRHLFLPTVGAVHVLAAKAGFRVARVLYDSDGLQFWGSERYRRGLPLRSPDGGDAGALLDATAQRGFERRAAQLNARGDGDQAAFLLRVEADGRIPAPAAATPARE